MAGTILAAVVGSTLAQETYLAKVGPPPLRFLIPRTALPSITLFADPRPKTTGAESNEVAAVRAAATTTPPKTEPDVVVGPPLPPSTPPSGDKKADTVSVNSGSQATVPSEIKLAGASAQEPVTAQMMVRFFRPAPTGLGNGIGITPGYTNVGGPSIHGSETAVFFPIQFQPPEPLGTRSSSSSASYEVTPKSSEVLEAGTKESKQPAVHP